MDFSSFDFANAYASTGVNAQTPGGEVTVLTNGVSSTVSPPATSNSRLPTPPSTQRGSVGLYSKISGPSEIYKEWESNHTNQLDKEKADATQKREEMRAAASSLLSDWVKSRESRLSHLREAEEKKNREHDSFKLKPQEMSWDSVVQFSSKNSRTQMKSTLRMEKILKSLQTTASAVSS